MRAPKETLTTLVCLAGAMRVVVYNDDERGSPPRVSRDVGEGAAAAPRPRRALAAATLAQAGRDPWRITPRKPYRLRSETHSMIGKAGGTTKRAHGVRAVQRACWPRRTTQERRLRPARAALRLGSFRRHTDRRFASSVWPNRVRKVRGYSRNRLEELLDYYDKICRGRAAGPSVVKQREPRVMIGAKTGQTVEAREAQVEQLHRCELRSN
jgi:hypothetical protein